jgi:Raf kinase inhibitor-like YbhB/YbcL family protein
VRRTLLRCSLLLLAAGCNRGDDAAQLDVGKAMSLTSTAFADGQPIPDRFTKDRSPPLKWADAPDGVGTFALICDDPDAPAGVFTHWVVWDIPGTARELPEGQPQEASQRDGTRQGKNDFGGVGYGGPQPPPGPVHHYRFRLYALDAPLLQLQEAATTRGDLESAMRSHVVGHGLLVGTYQK